MVPARRPRCCSDPMAGCMGRQLRAASGAPTEEAAAPCLALHPRQQSAVPGPRPCSIALRAAAMASSRVQRLSQMALAPFMGTTEIGGAACGCGTVFKLAPPTTPGGVWTRTVLHTFIGGSDGDHSNSGLVFDTSGALYGTTVYGGTGCHIVADQGCGTVFKLTPPIASGSAWSEGVLHAFTGENDGYFPQGGVVLDLVGGLYGVTYEGPGTGCFCGTVFKLTPPAVAGGAWREATLHVFSGGSDGDRPQGPLAQSAP